MVHLEYTDLAAQGSGFVGALFVVILSHREARCVVGTRCIYVMNYEIIQLNVPRSWNHREMLLLLV